MDQVSNNHARLLWDAGGAIALNTEPLEKSAKIGYRIIDLAASFGAISESFSQLAMHLKGGVAFFETVQFFGKTRELVCLDAKGNSFFAVNTWQKCVEKVSMAAHTILKAVRTLAVKGIVNLGQLAVKVGGNLTAFSLATDAFVILSCTFTIWESIKQTFRMRQDLSRIDVKITTWKARQESFAQNQASEQANAAYKLKKWEHLKHNVTLMRNKQMIAGVHSVSIIGVTSLGIALSVTNIGTAFALRSMLAAGIGMDSIGVFRFLYDYYNKEQLLK